MLDLITSIQRVLDRNLFMVSKNRKNGFSKLRPLSSGHLTVVSRQTWKIVNLPIKAALISIIDLLDFCSLLFVMKHDWLERDACSCFRQWTHKDISNPFWHSYTLLFKLVLLVLIIIIMWHFVWAVFRQRSSDFQQVSLEKACIVTNRGTVVKTLPSWQQLSLNHKFKCQSSKTSVSSRL